MTVFLAGGGPNVELAEALDEFIAQVRAREGYRIAIAIAGSADHVSDYVDGYASPLLARMPEAQIDVIQLSDEEPTKWPENPSELAGLVVAGGWTPGYLDALAPHQQLISELVRSGVPYFGFSAGAAIVSKHAIVGGWRHEGRQIANELASEGSGELEIKPGLALIAPSVDMHADSHSTLGRCIAALSAGEMSSTVAIDEATALAVDVISGKTRVYGAGRVTWVLRNGADFQVHFEQAPVSVADVEQP